MYKNLINIPLVVLGLVGALAWSAGWLVWSGTARAEEMGSGSGGPVGAAPSGPESSTGAPYLSVQSPEYPDGRYPDLILTVKDRELKVSGATAPGAAVKVNGVAAQVDAEGHFAAAIALHEGYNAIVFEAQWPTGAVVRVVRPVIADWVPPHLSVQPVPSDDLVLGPTGQRWFTVGDRVRLQGQVEPGATVTAGIEEPTFGDGLWGFWEEEWAEESEEGGESDAESEPEPDAEPDVEPGGRSSVPVASDGTFTWEGVLNDGTNHINIRATDVAGNVTEIPLVVVRSMNPPDLWIDEPLGDVSTREQTVTVRGTTDPDASVQVNGEPATVDAEGNFQVEVPLTADTNRIQIRAVDPVGNVAEVERVVQRDTDPPTVRSVLPSGDQQLSAGEMLYVQASGESGGTAWFNIGEKRLKVPMAEIQLGVYKGVYRIQPQDSFDGENITVVISDDAGNEGSVVGGSVSTLDPAVPTVVEVVAADATLRAGPDASFDRLAQDIQGMRFEVVARSGEWLKVRLSPTQTAWTHVENIRQLPLGTPPPNAVVSNVSATRTANGVRVTLRLSEPTPYMVVADVRTASLRVQLFNASFGLYHMSYGPGADLVELMSLSQPATGVSELLINLSSKHVAGYRARLEGGNLVIDISDPLTRSVKGLTITLDPGHGGPEPGAIGPTGLREADVNLRIALLLKDRLEAEGARVVMTRTGDTSVVPEGGSADLYARVDVAEQSGSDLFVSIHNNAVGAGNALTARGTEMYYYTPYSGALARSVQERLTANLGTANRFAAYRSFAVIRQWTMPAILVEGDFISHPDVEERMRGDEFAEKAAEGIFDGIVAFLEQVGEPE